MKREPDSLEDKFKKFPHHKLSENDQKDIHEALMKKRTTKMIPQKSKRVKNKWFAGFGSVAVVLIATLLGLGFFTDTFKDSDRVAQNSETSADHDRSDKSDSNEDTNEEANELNDHNINDDMDSDSDQDTGGLSNQIQEISDLILQAIDEKDTITVADYVHPAKGLLFSPYVNIMPDSVVFSQEDVSDMLSLQQTFHWGDYDGSGMPIELTPGDYFNEFLTMEPFLDADDVYINEPFDRGNTLNNIMDVFPDAQIVEYYNDGSEEYAGIDWQSIILVYETNDAGGFELVAIIRDMWTV